MNTNRQQSRYYPADQNSSAKMCVMDHSQQLIPYILCMADLNFPCHAKIGLTEVSKLVKPIEIAFPVERISQEEIVKDTLNFLSDANLLAVKFVDEKLIEIRLTAKGLSLLRQNLKIGDDVAEVNFRYFVRNYAKFNVDKLSEGVESALVSFEMQWARN